MKFALPFVVAAAVFASLDAEARAKKFVGFAWEFSRMSVTNLVDYVDELDKTPLDGIGVYLNECSADGKRTSTHNIMHEAWRRDALEPLVPVAQELTRHKSMRESFIGTFRAPFRKRIEWNDDEGWARIASNMTMAAWFAKAGGFRGISMDPEDYHYAGQFVRRGGDAPYEELVRLARQRGREVFAGVFKQYPDIRILSFWFLSMEHVYLNADNPAKVMRDRADLWPAFVNGIFDVMPHTARIIDGCEHSYRYESSKGDFYQAADAVRRRLGALVLQENKHKYRDLVGVSFGIYLDMFTNGKDASWYFGPVDGSRLRHFELNLNQAADAADEYIWFWGEKFCWADWRGKGPVDNRKINQKTWNNAVPGLEDVILAVKSPSEHSVRRMAALSAAGKGRPVNANSECVSVNGAVPAPYSPWQQKKNRQGRLYGDDTCGEGDNFSLAAVGVENGAFSMSVPGAVVPGDRWLVNVSKKGEGATASLCWKRDGKWDWNILSPVQVVFSNPDAEGWQKGSAVVRVPEGANGAGLILSVRQHENEKCNFDNVAIRNLEMFGQEEKSAE
jgi:hypothetical protein